MRKKQEKPIELSPEELTSQIQILQRKLEQAARDIEELKSQAENAIAKVGITRFNPFGEMGGDQSFSVALLNKSNTGVVITSYYGKELNRVFAKPVEEGKSPYELAEEEKHAIAKAMETI